MDIIGSELETLAYKPCRPVRFCIPAILSEVLTRLGYFARMTSSASLWIFLKKGKIGLTIFLKHFNQLFSQ